MATPTSKTELPKVVPQDDWLAARKELLKKEKEFTRLRDELSRQRRALPREKVEKRYEFDGPKGMETLADLFDGRSQLIVYHHVWAGMERGLPPAAPSWLIPSTALQCNWRSATRPFFAAISRATPAGDQSLQETYGMAVQVGVVVRQRIQL